MAAVQDSSPIGSKYEVVCNIGRGSFGIISKVRRKSDGKILCRKEINYLRMSTKEREQLQAEINILSSLRHPNIVSYFHRDHLKETQDLHLYMEYCGGGDLSKIIQRLAAKNELADEAYVWNVMAQLVSALYRCHYGVDPPPVPDNVMSAPKQMRLRTKDQWTILHRDLKPENVFLDEDDAVKLGDFGLSKSIQGGDFATTYVGTPYYMSPEICAGERYSSKSDIWSMGCILYELCTTRPPFDAKTQLDLIHKIRQGTYKPIAPTYSTELQSVIASCLKVNPLKRPATCDLLENPVIRLMRKEREVIETGRALKVQQAEIDEIRREAQNMARNAEMDREVMRREIDDALRREWEVKARLEIDRQVAIERQQLSLRWDEEFPKHVAALVEAKMNEFYAAQQQQREQQMQHKRSTSPDTVPNSSQYTNQTNVDDFTTDLSSLSLMVESPFKDPVSKKRNSRTPFSRNKALTQIDSPMDIQMVDPSPAAINSLSLSPRRGGAAAIHLKDASRNLFAANRGLKQQWQVDSLSEDDREFEEGLESEDDEVPSLPSPTLARGANDPFKAAGPRIRPSRPGLGRQQTMPAQRAGQQEVPTLFNQNLVSKAQIRSTSPNRQAPKRPSSPTRQRRTAGGLKAARTEADMHKGVVTRNAGRTLVELQHEQLQNRALPQHDDLVLPPKGGVSGNENYSEVAVWDPEECDEMPSPFLNRTRGREGLMVG